VFDDGKGVSELRIRGHILRAGRTQMFTEARIEDAADPDRVIAFGTTSFAVTGPPATNDGYGHGYASPTPAPGTTSPARRGVRRGRASRRQLRHPEPDARARRRPPALGGDADPRRGGVDERRAPSQWRHPPANRPARHHSDDEGRVGPFTVVSEILAIDDTSAGCRVEVVDVGAGNKSIALITVRLRIFG